jgi:RHS repeat-associated protein
MERTQVYSYDSLNRLSSAETISTNQPWWQGDNPLLNCWGEQYTYDAWGNFSAITPISSAYTGCSQESLSMSPTTKNQLQDTNNDYVYDSAGNLTQPGPIGGPYVYDAENHLTSAGGVTYTYDGDGNRVMKSNGTIYWYGANSASLEESDLSGNLQRWYYFFDGQRVGRQLVTNEVGFYMTDLLGSVRYLGGSATGYNIEYYPFGGVILNTDTGDDRYQFTAKERDSESGLDNFIARYNSSSLGRFMSPDPFNIAGDFVDSQDPQHWNMYSYVLNNPVNAVDPDGLDCVYVNGNSVDVQRGDCTNAGGKDDNGIFVNGTIDIHSGTYDSSTGTVGFNYTNDDTGAIGKGVIGNVYPSDGVSDADRLNALGLAGQIAAPGVNLAANGLRAFGYIVAAPLMAIAECGAAGKDCSATGTALAIIPLTGGARKILGGILPLADETVANAIRIRGGGGAQVNQVASWLAQKTVGEVANLAAQGNAEARTAIKIVKDAARLAQK